MDSPSRGDEVRLLKPHGVPSAYHGKVVEVAETVDAAPGAIRIRDRAMWDGPTERDEDEFAQDDVHAPYTITQSDYEVVNP